MKNITIIEDDIVLSQTLQRRLQRAGYHVVITDNPNNVQNELNDSANSWCKADSQCKTDSQYRANIYLIDLRLGNQSGLGLIEPLRQACPESQIIVMTGFASIATAVNAIKLGANDYLPKPLVFKQLIDTIEGRKGVELAVPEEIMSPERIEWEHIQKVLADNDGNVSATARELGMYRRTLQRKLAKHPVKS